MKREKEGMACEGAIPSFLGGGSLLRLFTLVLLVFIGVVGVVVAWVFGDYYGADYICH